MLVKYTWLIFVWCGVTAVVLNNEKPVYVPLLIYHWILLEDVRLVNFIRPN